MTETDPMPNPVADDSERAEGKSKKREGFRKPNTEPAPSRTLNFRHIDAQDVMYWQFCIMHLGCRSWLYGDKYCTTIVRQYLPSQKKKNARRRLCDIQLKGPEVFSQRRESSSGGTNRRKRKANMRLVHRSSLSSIPCSLIIKQNGDPIGDYIGPISLA
jgi:hypothetical protein